MVAILLIFLKYFISALYFACDHCHLIIVKLYGHIEGVKPLITLNFGAPWCVFNALEWVPVVVNFIQECTKMSSEII